MYLDDNRHLLWAAALRYGYNKAAKKRKQEGNPSCARMVSVSQFIVRAACISACCRAQPTPTRNIISVSE